ncbi:MAG: hypothetical protein CME88_10005 [Hirschia sp.]|uniref:Uncharacterized protein n=1 Tax=Maricaulis virginensis TaxID=144022 RepID=A0A9W6ILZ2_9PROT|nr:MULTISPECIES: hypothetical protein [Alphaproteobacteria]MBB36332.1 hypothetical protein [Hirschia sp.]MBF18700.1 hypothetical protein [Hirschia sp.]GLK51714.1 hypothetical protein GCM10017621_12220 [Maricaulis virginensis]
MKAEPLNIRDKRFLINRLIEQAPVSTLVREFFKNADESAVLAETGNRRIEIYPTTIDGVRKLTFWNTGVGMDDRELKQATDLSSSINKEMALDGNFGIGAKVSGLTMSREGIRYRSCKSGIVNEVTIGFDADEGTYVRFPVELPDGSSDTVYDVTDVAREAGQDTAFDWTEVVLLGQSEDHDTVAEPLGKGKSLDRSFIPSAIFRRFARFGEGVEVRVDVAMTKGGGKGETGRTRRLKTLEDVVDELPNHERVEAPGGEVIVHYIHDPKHERHSHSLSALANPATSSTTFCALVHKGERYDIKSKKAWSAAAPNFGIPFGSKVLTIEIELADNVAMPNQYRDGLTWPDDRSPMVAEDFDAYVRELMPEWVREVIRSESPSSDDNLDDLQTDLQKLLDEFRVPTATLSPSRRPMASPTEDTAEGTDTSDPVDLDTDFPETGDELDENGDKRDPSKSQRAKHKKVRKAPDGAKLSRSAQSLERVPEIKILTDPEEIAEKNLKGRAGRFYKDAQTLFVNGLYSVVERMAVELDAELRTSGEPEVVRTAILRASRKFMAFRVGKATCYAISKRLSDDWSSDDLDRATSPESLSLAADDYKQSISQAKRYAKELIKTADVPEEHVA